MVSLQYKRFFFWYYIHLIYRYNSGKFMHDPLRLDCMHRFCRPCLMAQLSNSLEPKCILCQKSYSGKQLKLQPQLAMFINTYTKFMTELRNIFNSSSDERMAEIFEFVSRMKRLDDLSTNVSKYFATGPRITEQEPTEQIISGKEDVLEPLMHLLTDSSTMLECSELDDFDNIFC